MKKYLFWVAVYKHPTLKQQRDGEGATEVIVQPKTVLATNEKSAAMMVSREIPAEHMDDPDRLEVAVSSF